MNRMFVNPIIIKYDNGNISSKTWINNEGYHNENGPAIIYYYRSGKIQTEQYCINDEWHNENGPAVIYYDELGNVVNQSYYFYDELFKTLTDLQNHIKTLILK